MVIYLLDISTAILYKAGTGPEQCFPCVVFPHREKPVFIAGFPVDENRFFPVGNTTQGIPCFHYRDGFAVFIISLVNPRYNIFSPDYQYFVLRIFSIMNFPNKF